MNHIDELSELFRQFPGIGPRQAKRFVFFLLRKNKAYTEKLIAEIQNLKTMTKHCPQCNRFFSSDNHMCDICRDEKRDASLLMIVAKDTDLETIEKTHTYDGLYFVLGSTLAVMDRDLEKYVDIHTLIALLNTKKPTEVVLSLPVNPEGDHTATLVKQLILKHKPEMNITMLGRGISTGVEIEYVDTETIKNALKNRG
jgi:recombination protein RecR